MTGVMSFSSANASGATPTIAMTESPKTRALGRFGRSGFATTVSAKTGLPMPMLVAATRAATNRAALRLQWEENVRGVFKVGDPSSCIGGLNDREYDELAGANRDEFSDR